MSRNVKYLSPDVIIIFGDDHAVGSFFQVIDNRFAGTIQDEQGEGYVFDWDNMFGTTINLINLNIEEFKRKDIDAFIIELCNEFVSKLVV